MSALIVQLWRCRPTDDTDTTSANECYSWQFNSVSNESSRHSHSLPNNNSLHRLLSLEVLSWNLNVRLRTASCLAEEVNHRTVEQWQNNRRHHRHHQQTGMALQLLTTGDLCINSVVSIHLLTFLSIFSQCLITTTTSEPHACWPPVFSSFSAKSLIASSVMRPPVDGPTFLCFTLTGTAFSTAVRPKKQLRP